MERIDMEKLQIFKQLKWYEMQHRSHCTICGKRFKHEDMCYVGFLINNDPAHMCDLCKKHAVEVIKLGKFANKDVMLPRPGDKLWRYMDFTKFIHLLETCTLYFPRVDQFDDPYEGALGVKVNEETWIESEVARRRTWFKANASVLKLTEDDIEKLSVMTLDQLRARFSRWRNINYVSCWHMSECESEAMWKLYAGNNKNSISIQTTFEHLFNALPIDFNGDFGAVKYINYKEYNAGDMGMSIHPFNSLWYKRESFAHEKEFRIKIEDMTAAVPHKLGMNIKVDLQMLVQGIYVSPWADSYFYDLVMRVLERYGLRIHVSRSEMLEEPLL